MLQRHGVAVRCPDRERLASFRHCPGERDDASGGGSHVRAEVTRDVDAAMLAPGIGVVAEDERPEH